MDPLSHVLAGLRGVLSDAKALPAGPIEPADLFLSPDTESVGIGSVCAPRAVMANDIVVLPFPRTSRPGQCISLGLALSLEYLDEVGEAGVSAATSMLCDHAVAKFRLSTSTGAIDAEVIGIVSKRSSALAPGVVLQVKLPSEAKPGSKLELVALVIAGQPVPVDRVPPILICVARGTPAPREIYGACSGYAATPAVSPEGVIYIGKTWTDALLVDDAWGEKCGSIPLRELGLGSRVVTAALTDDGTLLLGEDQSERSRLLAVHPETHEVRWRTAPGAFGGDILGIAVIESLGIAVVSDSGGALRLHKLDTGERLGSFTVAEPRFSAFDASSGSLFVNVQRFDVGLYTFPFGSHIPVPSGVCGQLRNGGEMWCPLAIVPPAQGRACPYLVVGSLDTPDLCVYSVPGLERIHSHTLTGVKVVGLVGDPAGTALIVCDSISRNALVLTWPLPGMELLP